ncbi:putative MFS family arabinose efflux permease [Micromonospora sp. Llam0]|uniref:MFS transporter n=1 Tax=Micromonospora sp. Llam0 TaxID=2485143 RepID=UPI000F47347C|nr:MFS transporter [Micromonospora sp. Llam0]ROO61155.1 putative MFS family arabinose efflux permease [Micromonospora sp. Llam0]
MTAPAAPPIRIVGNSAVAAVGILAGALGTLESVVSPTLPLLQRELSIDPAQGALLSIAMLITGALTAPIAGVLGDRHGGKRVLIWLMVVVTAGGLVSSLAPNLLVLLLGQGLEGAMVGAMPLSFILMRKLLPADRSPVAIGVVSGFFVGGGMLGTLIAGPIAEGLSRHWMFAIPTMAIVAATVLVHRLLPDDRPSRTDARIDWPGMLLLSGIVLTFMAGLATAPDMGSQPLLLVGVVVLLAVFVTGWVAVERRAATPMFDLRLLARPAIWRSYVVTFAACIGAALSIYLVPQLFAVSGDGYGFGASPTDIGRYLLPAAAMAAISGPLGGLGVRRFGSTAVVAAGIVLMTAGLIGMALVHTEVWHLVVGKALISLANGVCITALVIKTATSVDQGNTGTATSMVLVIRVLGFATGAQIGGAVLTAGTSAGSDIPAESAYVTALVIASVVTTLSLLALRTMSKGARN